MKHKQLSFYINSLLYLVLSSIPVILAAFIYPDYVPKEAYIHMGYIEGLLNGEGFTFRGQISYGSPSPMWIVMGSFVAILFEDTLFSVRLLSGVFSFLSVFIFLKLADTLKIKSFLKFAAALALCLNPFFLRWAICGTEASAATAVFLFLIYAYSDRYHVRHPYIYGLLLGFASLVRPEFILFSIIFVLHLLLINKHHQIKAVISFSIFLLIIAGWLIFALLYFGSVVPGYYTVYSETESALSGIDILFTNVKYLLGSNVPEFILLVISSVPVIILLVKKEHSFLEDFVRLSERLKFNGIILGLIFMISVYSYYILKGIVVSQIILMFIPLIILTAASIINLLTNYKSSFNLSLISVYSIMMILTHTHITFTILKPSADLYVKGYHNAYTEIANFIRTDENGQYKTVATDEAGIIGYYAGVQVYDLSGLTSTGRKEFSSDYDYLNAKKPGYIVLKNDDELEEFIPENITTHIIYMREIPVMNPDVNHTIKLSLYKIHWNEKPDPVPDQIELPDPIP